MTARRRRLLVLAAAASAGLAAGLIVGIGDGGESPPSPGSTLAPPPLEEPPAKPGPPANGTPEELPPPEQDRGAAPGPSGPAPAGAEERAAASAARGYVQALDLRSGESVCRAFAPGALDLDRLPRRRRTCPASVEASLGFSNRGRPAWKSSRMTDDVSAQVEGASARVVATVFTTYADVREPTIEDDIIYLARRGDRWLVAKPSLTFHRAIGNPGPPPSVLSPP